MTIDRRSIGDVTILAVQGRITVQDGADVLCDTVQVLAGQGRSKLVLDFHNVPYIDSTAIGEIIHAYTTVTRNGGSLKLLHVGGRVHDLLALTKLLSVFEHFDAEADAVASFGIGSV